MDKAVVITIIAFTLCISIMLVCFFWFLTSRKSNKQDKIGKTGKGHKSDKKTDASGITTLPISTLPIPAVPTSVTNKNETETGCECNCCAALNSLIAKLGTSGISVSQTIAPIATVPVVPTNLPASILPQITPTISTMPTPVPVSTANAQVDPSKSTSTIVQSSDGAHQYSVNLKDKLGEPVSKTLIDVRKLMASNSEDYDIYRRKPPKAIQDLVNSQTKATALRDTTQATGSVVDQTTSLINSFVKAIK